MILGSPGDMLRPSAREEEMRKLVVTLVALLAVFTFIRDLGASGSEAGAPAKAELQAKILP